MAQVRRVSIILNPVSGAKRTGYPPDEVGAAFAAAGIPDAEILLLRPGLDVGAAVAERVRNGTDAIVGAGGDGTVSSVAAALAGTQTPLGVVPAGTLNHFARDLGIPSELEDAARVIASGRRIRVDVGKVNGNIFVNNSSIGIYPALVNTRDALMEKRVPKRLATVAGIAAAVWKFPNTTVRLSARNTELVARTPFVFIGNNDYTFSGLQVGERATLQDGLLQVCSVSDPSRVTLFRALLAAVARGADAAPELAVWRVKQVHVRTMRKRIPVALDGEVHLMRSPLDYEIWPGALNVMAPAES